MKKLLTLLFTFALFTILLAGSANAQIPVTVTNNTNTTPNLLATYPSLAAALTDLNLVTAMTGPVTLTLTGPNSETTPPTGLIIGSATLNPVLSATNSVLINTTGGTVTLNAGIGTATPASAAPDGILAIVGADYITINGLTFTDGNAANPATMEFGVALFKFSVTDGAQYNTIQNCTFNMQRINNATGSGPMVEGSAGIRVVNATNIAAVTALTPTSAAGTNSFNKFYTNILNGGNYGIALYGYSGTTPFTLCDFGNDVGGSSSGQGNQILNYGGGAAATNPAAGIRANFQWGINISYNIINNNNGGGVNHATTLRGIYGQAGVSANATISFNTITVNSGATTSILTAIENVIGSTAASNTVNISNNTITGCTYSTATTGAFNGIVNSATAATVNINNNTISGISTPGTGGIIGIAGGSPTNLNINFNNINSITKTGIGLIYGINPGTATLTVQNNTIDGLSCTAASSTAVIYGTYDISSPSIENYSNNIIRNLSSTGTATLNGIRIVTATGNKTLQNNQIYNFTVAGGNGIIYGIYKGYGSTDDVSGNSIYNLQITGATTSGTIYGLYNTGGTTVGLHDNQIYQLNCAGGTSGSVYGLYNTVGAPTSIYKNNIYNLSSGGTGTPLVYGLYLGGGTTNHVYNNFISDLRTPASGAAISLVGIYVSGGTTDNLFYNTVYMNATSSGALFGSSAVYASTTPTLDMRNNILVNVSTPVGATGFTTAYRRSTTTLTTYASTSNNNDFYAGTPGVNNLIMYDGTNSYQTMAAYQTAVSPRDAASFRELPPFVNVATTPYDLHLNTFTPTQCESGGVTISSPIAITTDYDAQTRNATTPDIGADEGTFMPLDLSAPNISYTPLSNTALTGARTLTTTITDASGVPTAGIGLPVLYWKIGAGAYSGVQGVWVSGSTYSFTFGAGVVLNDVVSYYICAQDLAGTPNVGGFPAGGSGYLPNPPSATTPTLTPSSYTIVGGISGTINVGALETYTSLTADAATGLFKAINNLSITGNITVNIVSDLTETGAIALNQTSEDKANYTITIQPDASTMRTISGSYVGGLIRLNGADRVTFDGTAGKYLTFSNTSTSSSSVFQIISLGTGFGATNNTIKNCIISSSAGAAGATSYGISVGGSTAGTSGADNDNNTIQNNTISGTSVGIYAIGTASVTSGGNDNLLITQNTITVNTITTTANYGIEVGNGLNSTISQNTISVTSTASGQPVGISLETGFVSSSVSRNLLSTVTTTATGGYGGRGITVGTGTASSGITISNNVIYGVNGSNYSSFTNSSAMGICIGTIGNSGTLTTTAGGINLYYNSVNMYGNHSYATACLTAALYVGTGASALDIRNNIFSNFLNNTNTSGSGSKDYCIYSAAANTAFTTINYNDYYPLTPATTYSTGYVGYIGSDRADIAAWRTGSGQDVNSQSANPLFTSNTDLRLQLGSTLLGAGVAIGGITTDFLGVARGTPPTIGAYEVGLDAAPPAITYTAFSNTSSTTDRTLTATITDYSGTTTTGSLVPRIYYKKGTGGTWYSRAGVLQTGSGTNGTWDFTIVYSDFGGVILGDYVYYYVIAQDIATPINIGSVPSAGLVATDVNTVTTPPTTPYNYKIVGTPMAGTYSIGINPFNKAIGKNLYGKTLTRTVKVEAPAIVNQVDDKVSSNNESKDSKVEQNTLLTPIKRIHNKYNEDSKSEKKNYIDITEEYTVLYENDHPYTGENYISISGKGDAPNGIYSTITAAMTDLYERGTSGNVIFTLVDNVYNVGTGETFPLYVINPGSFNVTMKPTLPNTVISSSTIPTTDVLMYLAGNNVTIDGAVSGTTRDLTISSTGLLGWTFYFGAYSSGNTLKNCKVNCGSTQSSTGVIQIEGGSAGTGSNNHTIDNCEIYDVGTSRPEKGVIIWGNGATANGNTVKNNDIHDYGNSNGGNGVYITANANNNLIQKNNIYTTSTPAGASSSTNYGIYITGANTGTIIEQNNIHDLANANVAGAIKGIYLFGTTGARDAIVRNNSISLGSAFPMNGATIYGIDDFGFSLNTWYIYYNSVRINGTATSGNSYCFAKRDVTNQEFFNNVGYNNRSGGTANYGIFVNTSGTGGTINMNYNGYYADGTPGTLGYWNATPYSTLLAWQTASGKDANSVTGDPMFISATNLHIQTSAVSPVSNAGTYIASVLNDIDGDVRNVTTPDIGADEYTYVPPALTLGFTALIQGFYDGISAMIPDTVTIELRNSTTPFALVDSKKVLLSATGTANPTFTTAVNGTPYYIVVKHRNLIETWSATAQTFSGSALTYDFTTSAGQAYGSNQVFVGNKWCMYNGDVNQDRTVDIFDMLAIDADVANFVTGYVPTDLNGDQSVDIFDMLLCDNNVANFVGAVVPPGAMVVKVPKTYEQMEQIKKKMEQLMKNKTEKQDRQANDKIKKDNSTAPLKKSNSK